jgi:outer membrane protein assembly factor BamA
VHLIQLSFSIILFFLAGFSASGQKTALLHYTDNANKATVALDCQDSLECSERLLKILSKHRSDGYLLCSLDSTHVDSLSNFHAFVYLGKSFELFAVATTSLPFPVRSLNKPILASSYQAILDGILFEFGARGFPFAAIETSLVDSIDKSIVLNLAVKSGPLILIDSLIIKSKDDFHQPFFTQYLNLKQGEIYNERRIRLVDKRLRALPYLKQVAPVQTVFTTEGADIYVSVEKSPSNRFNGIAGLQQDPESGDITITGDLDLRLLNAFRRGEEISLNWRRPRAETQELKAQFNYPYILHSQIGLSSGLAIFRQDSSFSTTSFELGVLYQFLGSNFLKAFVAKNKANSGTSNLNAASFGNTSITSYGLELRVANLDHPANPSSGYSAEIKGGIGEKTILADEGVESQTQRQWNSQVSGDVYLGIGQQWTANFGLDQGLIQAPTIFNNEMHRVGGLKTLRGFDESSIFTTSFATGSIELRYLLDNVSHLALFYNRMWYEKRGRSGYTSDSPFGFGAGAQLGVNNGLISIYYALGSEMGNPILLRNGKVHFGFTSVF